MPTTRTDEAPTAGPAVLSKRAGPDGAVALLELRRGKVNALTLDVVKELDEHLDRVGGDEDSRGLVLTGSGSFFSFGFDVPAMYDLEREAFGEFLYAFCALSRRLFSFPKPVIAALNGHASAGGCILALTADERIAAEGRGRIGLNERLIGASLFSSCVEMLAQAVGDRTAERMLYSGELSPVAEAHRMGLVDRLVPGGELVELAVARAATLAENPGAFAGLKWLLRRERAERMAERDPESIERFLDVWYAPDARRLLRGIEIRG